MRQSGVLGRSVPMQRLFDHLVECSKKGETPREIDIAVEVFGRDSDFDISQDASVRVYVHRLRQKLDSFYEEDGREETERLVLPKGDYRLQLESHEPILVPAAPLEERPPRRKANWGLILASLAVVLAINAAIWAAIWPRDIPDERSALRHASVWAPFFEDERTTIIAVGDYYIFGELGTGSTVERLVREFSINSKEDLYSHQMLYPQESEAYVDVGLRYLPTSTAHALSRVLPLIASAGDPNRMRVVLSSELTPGMLKTAHIIYVGYLSALDTLRDPVFAASRYEIGNSYDEIVDRGDGTTYVSQMGSYDGEGGMSIDYGLVSAFNGPTGNRIVVIAGTRDVALRQMAEIVTDPPSLTQLESTAGNPPALEGLYAVEALNQYNMGASLLAASSLDSARIWNSSRTPAFPPE